MNTDKKEIIIRMMEIFESFGIRSLTIDFIAQKIPMHKKELEKIGKNKKEIIQEIFNFKLENNKDAFEKIKNNKNDTNSIDELINLTLIIHKRHSDFNSHLEFELKKYYPKQFATHEENKDNFTIQEIIKNIEKGKREAYYKFNLNPELTAITYFEKIRIHNNQNKKVLQDTIQDYIYIISNIRGIQYYETKKYIFEEIIKIEL